MRLNPANLKKDELIRRLNYHCQHGHDGLSHWECFNKEKGIKERIGYLDIECSNLNADFGIVLSYCIKEDGVGSTTGPEDGEDVDEYCNKNGILHRVLTQREIRNGTFDAKLLEQCAKDMKKFDRIITYYGARFDIPFLRTRSIHFDLDFPLYREVKHTDAFDVVKRKLKLHRRSLAVVCDFFDVPSKGHRLNPEIWQKCLSGDKAALQWVLMHNVEDVISTELAWHKIEKYARLTDTSI